MENENFRFQAPLSIPTLFIRKHTMLKTIRNQTLTLIAEITANPKPTYTIDGQSVAWTDYLAQLRKTVEWCDRMIADEEPVEIISRAC